MYTMGGDRDHREAHDRAGAEYPVTAKALGAGKQRRLRSATEYRFQLCRIASHRKETMGEMRFG